MKKRLVLVASCGLALAILLAGCTWFGTESLVGPQSLEVSGDYILAFSKLPSDIEATIEAYGGSVRSVLEAIDVVTVRVTQEALVAIEGIEGFVSAAPDVNLQWLPDEQVMIDDGGEVDVSTPYFRQWNLYAIDAMGAWEEGYTGDGVRVAVCDTGIDPDHPDFGDNVNVELSYSFVDWEPDIEDYNGHGSHVAGIIAAADNDVRVIGVAPNAEIVALKTNDATGGGLFSFLLEALIYAADVIDADVVNMSLGALWSHSGYVMTDSGPVYVGADAINTYAATVRKTLDYAQQQGVLLVASAGNSAMDGTGDAGWIHVPSDIGGCLTVSATGPQGFGLTFDPFATDLDLFAVYSNYGPQVDFAAPGGNIDWSLPYPFPLADDWVYSTYYSGYYAWVVGTSQAAPHVAGVAALIIEKNGGEMKPSHVLRELRASTDDLGKPGQDPYYGYGRVNAAQAVAP